MKNYTIGDIVHALQLNANSDDERASRFASAALQYFNEITDKERQLLRAQVNRLANSLRDCSAMMAMELLYVLGGYMSKYDVTGSTIRNEVAAYTSRLRQEAEVSRKQGRQYR